MNLKCLASVVFSVAVLAATPSYAGSLFGLKAGSDDIAKPFEIAAVDCDQPAKKVVRQTGGELLSATPTQQNGKQVCKVTVLVKSGNGQRPKKMSVTVPAG